MYHNSSINGSFSIAIYIYVYIKQPEGNPQKKIDEFEN